MTTAPIGLRERKKARTRAAIRDHAMRLFDEQGYAATTVDQIAAAADVSASTFFRYFPTKEDVVLADDHDPMLVEAVRSQPVEVRPVQAIRTAMLGVLGRLSPEEVEREHARQRLIRSVPELRARALQQYTDSIDLLAGVVAERSGLPADDFAARVLAGAVIGALLAVATPGDEAAYGEGAFARFGAALTLLDAGLPLDRPVADDEE